MDILALCAVLLAFLGWMAVEANRWNREQHKGKTKQQRRDADRNAGAWGEE